MRTRRRTCRSRSRPPTTTVAGARVGREAEGRGMSTTPTIPASRAAVEGAAMSRMLLPLLVLLAPLAAAPAAAQDVAPLDTRLCPNGEATLPNGSPCPPIATQQGGSPAPQVQGAEGNPSRNNNNTGGAPQGHDNSGSGSGMNSGGGATTGQ